MSEKPYLSLQEFDELNKKVELETKKSHLDAAKDYYKLRKDWSSFLMTVLALLVIFQITLTLFVGVGFFNFVNNQWFINSIVAETFLQIVGMCIIVVKFLYPTKEEREAKKEDLSE